VTVRDLRNKGGHVVQRVVDGETRTVTLAELTVGPLVARLTTSGLRASRTCSRRKPISSRSRSPRRRRASSAGPLHRSGARDGSLRRAPTTP
jgi:antitoxin (DNA-binding transcriptional repressor) of toxin-antitoxin stability system